METNKKQYGLILPKKGPFVLPGPGLQKPSAFDESDSEEESNVDWVKKALQKETYGGGALSRQSKADIQRVLQEDPTAYQYDEVYDEIERKKNEAVAAKKSERKPKYVQLLIAQAEKRKKEDERRKERQIQKEREAEGDEFADKECFVTTAYKKKLEEMKKQDEEEKRQDYLEEIGDVTKQKDLSGIYRYMYEKIAERDTAVVKEEPKDEDESKNTGNKAIHNIKSKAQRQYRRRVSESDSASENESSQTVINNKKSDHERKCQIRSSEEKHLAKKTRVEIPCPDNTDSVKEKSDSRNIDADTESSSDDHDIVSKSPSNRISKDAKKAVDDESDISVDGEKPLTKSEVQKDEEKEKKPKRLIWEKRTVGEVYDAALLRYYERKANRLVVLAN